MFFVGCRFAAAALAVDWCRALLRGITWREVRAGGAVGLAIVAGYGGQTIGLQHITSSESAFLTALYAGGAAAAMAGAAAPRAMTWVGVALACMGLMLLTGNNPASISFSYGQLITIAGAVAIAAEILLISHYARSVDRAASPCCNWRSRRSRPSR